MEGTAANQYTSYLVNRFPFQGFAKDDFAYKNLKDSIGDLTGKDKMLTDENANTYDQVDLAPHRWRKPAQPPMEPLRKPTAEKIALNKEEHFERFEEAECIKVSGSDGIIDDMMPELTKQPKKNVFSNLFKSKQAKKPFFSRSKNKLE